MNQKEPYYSPLLSSIQNTSLSENSNVTIETAKKAYEKFFEHHFNNQKITIKHQNNLIELKTLLGNGDDKLVFDLGNGEAIALLNIETHGINIRIWNDLIKEEVMLSQKLRRLGLCTQAYEETTLYFDDYPTKALKMPNFVALATQGQQVRDIKNNAPYGTSLLFENRANLQSFEHWHKVLEGFQEDLIIYFSQNLVFGGDTFNLAVVDSTETPAHDRTALALFTERKQKVHFCFYDFFSKSREYKEIKYDFYNYLKGSLDKKFIEEKIGAIFPRVIEVIALGLLPVEYVNILGGIHTLLLVSEDTVVKEIPEKTIILKKIKNNKGNEETQYRDYDAYVIRENTILRREIDALDPSFPEQVMLDLHQLHTTFLLPGEKSKKISINENRILVQSIESACGVSEYFHPFRGNRILEIAETALDKVKPLFIKAVADVVMEKLEQLSQEKQQNKEELANDESRCAMR